MQYILTQEEYDKLTKANQAVLNLSKEKLQVLCTKIADTMPINLEWGGQNPKPWQCILTADFEYHTCDCCPVQDICPNEAKEWSK